MEDIKAEDIDFVQTASAKSKSIGHNKFQVQLQEANVTIENLQSILDEKNSELELFKNNMREFQSQIQTKNTDISILNNQLSDLTNRFNKLNTEFETYKHNSQQFTSDIDNDNLQITDLNKSLHEKVLSLNSELDNTSLKYEELKNKYQLTLILLDKKTNECKDTYLSYENVNNELNLYKELNTKQQTTIDMLTNELQAAQNESAVLRTRIFEKDAYLGELNKKIALQQQSLRGKKSNTSDESGSSQVKEELEQPEQPPQEQPIIPPENIVNINNRQIKVTEKKIKVSRR